MGKLMVFPNRTACAGELYFAAGLKRDFGKPNSFLPLR